MLEETTDKNKLTEVVQFLKESKLSLESYDKVDGTNWVIIAKKM